VIAQVSNHFHRSIAYAFQVIISKRPLSSLSFESNFSLYIFPQVHLELAKYNDMGRFTNHEPQMDCATFHLEQSAACSVLPALVTMAEIYLQLPHDILASATVQVRKSIPDGQSSSFLMFNFQW